MQEAFYHTAKLPKELLQPLTIKDDHPAVLKYVLMIVLFVVSAIASVFLYSFHFGYALPFVVLNALMVCSIFASIHETIHGTAFKDMRKNRWAALISGFLHFYPPSLFRELHFYHHRYTHIPGKDPEISLGSKVIPSILSKLRLYVGWITGLPVLIFKWLMMFGGVLGMPNLIRSALFPFVSEKAKRRVFLESFFFIVSYVAIIYFLWNVPGAIMLVVGQLLGHSFLMIYLSMEHNGLPHEGNILEKTRSINAAAWIKWIMWNMPYHAEHHAYPAVPFHQLPTLKVLLLDEMPNKDLGPLGFHKEQINRFLKRNH